MTESAGSSELAALGDGPHEVAMFAEQYGAD
jgi:hypothetical protein